MAHYSKEWFYPTGGLATNQRAIIFGPGDDNAIAPIFGDAGLTIPLSNPTVTDPATGVLDFYAADGTYQVWVGPTNGGNGEEITLGANPGNPVLTVNSIAPDGGGNVTLAAADVGADVIGSAAAAAAASQPLATIDAKGDLYVGTADNATTRLAVGADTFVLTADSAQVTGMRWAAGGGGGGSVDSVNGVGPDGFGNVQLTSADVGAQPIATINAKGDLYAGTANDATARLPVGTDAQVLRANSAQTTGLEYHTLVASDVGAVPTTRTFTAGTALSGGGDLSADRTFDVDLGTTAGTAAEGNDSRIVGAQQRSTLITKGDLYAATAAATVTREPIGTDGQVLTADSAQATGMRWVTPAVDAVSSVNGKVGVVVLTSADVGAQPIATIDAKGDLYAGTANDAVSRLAVGADAQVLRANSAQATGLEYHTLVASDVGAVPTTRTLTAGTALSGGGDLSADRTFDVDLGTTAGTAAEGNDSRIVGAQQRSTLTTKGDLYAATASATTARLPAGTDGQVLSANSAQATGLEWVAAGGGGIPATIFGAKGDLIAASAADTAARLAVGSDGQYLRAASGQSTGLEYHTIVSSDVGAQPIATVTTKGDLYVATASATVARQGVGTDGYRIVADSTVTNGLKWNVPSSAAIFPRSTGYMPTGGVVVVRSSKAATQDVMYLIPFYLLIGATLSSLAYEVSGAVALAVVRTGIYGTDPTTMLPTGAAVADYGQTASATTGAKTVAVSTPLTPGLWWVAFVGQVAAPTIRQGAGFSPYVANASFPTGSGSGWDGCYVQTGVSGSLPTIGSLADSDGPIVGVKF